MSVYHKLPKLRPAGALERYCTTRNGLSFYHNVGLTYVIHLPSTSSRLLYLIRAAVAQTILVHPILSAVPVNELSPDAYFALLPYISLTQVVQARVRDTPIPRHSDETDAELDAMLQEQHNVGFGGGEEPEPFWRVIVLLERGEETVFSVSFIYHHGLGDGHSGLAFFRTFAAALFAKPIELGSDIVVTSVLPPLLPSVDTLRTVNSSTPSSSSSSGLIKTNKADVWVGSKLELFSPMKSRSHSVTLPEPTVTRFVNRCRTYKTTVTAALQALFATILFRTIPENYSTLICQGTVSIRRFLPAPITNDCMGMFISGYEERYERADNAPGSGFSWDEAIRSRAGFEAVLKREENGDSKNMSSTITDMADWMRSMLGQRRNANFEVSNLGRELQIPAATTSCNITDEQPHKPDSKPASSKATPQIGRTVFSTSASVIGRALKMNVVTSGEGTMSLSFAWQEGVVEEELMEKVMEGIKHGIEALAELGTV